MSWFLFLAVARADDAPTEQQNDFAIGGWLAPEFVALSRPDGLPVDRTVVGMKDATAGLEVTGEPFDDWSFLLRLVLNPIGVPVVDQAHGVDLNNDGSIDSVDTTQTFVLGDVVDEAKVQYAPLEQGSVTLGKMRVPFTLEARYSDTQLLFPSRAVPTQLFFDRADLGGTVDATTEWVSARVGLFNGTGTAVGQDAKRSLLWAGRIDVTPLGPIPSDPFKYEPFAFLIGGGATYSASTLFDDVGYEDVGVEDKRLSASAQVSAYGLGLTAEMLRRLETDTLTARPTSAGGTYLQASYLFLFGLQPIVRYSTAEWDQTFDPRKGMWIDGGLNVYPAARSEDPTWIKLTGLFVYENRITEGERAFGADVQALLIW